ncbi:MAG: transcription antitermination factor NusB [Deltaproteobacteria bacterium]|nr:transcription antitermination factor NusB [Deltaproteobacteria bacterium]MBW1736574.1 transcription antitermination factor NusB [Deltaproteobacteria bacterium]MBW1909452.1 transcription antitermination factor NusB [Deltaproteobacteria bacterium]MBW2032671.1 transcription antitermination factor NusB [Deltaproteobacteria bacterium]MBW2113997.1 transcription antitermination factor NusB [Deltaproteobacteria bacterium]
MGRRRKARELAIQVLFNLEFSSDSPTDVFDLICEMFNSGRAIRSFSKELVLGVCKKRDELDGLIGNASKNWRLERMSRIDKCILRLATFEILFMDDIPPKVSIDEAVEIGKKFGSDGSGGFINGVLDNIYNKLVQQGRLKNVEDEN